MKTHDKLAPFIVFISILVCLLSVLIMYYGQSRSKSARLASHIAKKNEEDTFWSDSEKSTLWYAVPEVASYDSPLIKTTFIQMFEDSETKEFIKEAIEQADSWALQTWYNVAKAVMSWFSFTHTDMNGILQRGSMLVVSSEQFSLLLEHADIQLTDKNESRMIDLGAGDGKVTLKMSHNFQHIFATETSKPMKSLLNSRNITVLPVENWSKDLEDKFDLISCLNLLDRCDNPKDIIEEVKAALKPNGLFLVALVYPFKPFVEARNSRTPSQDLGVIGDNFIDQVESFVNIMKNEFGFKLKSWTRVPYLCEGDLVHSIYYLDDALYLFSL